jgi:hypothetical protein
MSPVLSHFNLDGWHFRDLMTFGLWIITSQPMPASQTVGGPEFNQMIYCCHRQQFARMPLMSRLSAALTPL